jgi:hypothetical protein
MRWPLDRRKVTCATCGYLYLMHRKRVWLGQREVSEVPSEWGDPLKQDVYQREPVRLEVDPVSRQTGQVLEDPRDSLEGLRCFKHVVDYESEVEAIFPQDERQLPAELNQPERAKRQGHISSQLQEAIQQVLDAQRSCQFWYPYQRGYGPELHRDLEERHRIEAAARLWNLIAALAGAVVGGGIAVLAGWLLAR